MNKSVTDGLLKKNLVFCSGIFTAVIALMCDKLSTALMVTISACFITLISSVLTVVFFQNSNYYIQIAFNAVVSSICYIPAYLLVTNIAMDIEDEFFIYYPLLIVTSVWMFRIQRKDFMNSTLFSALARLFFFLLGSVIAALIIAAVRELLAYGTLFGIIITKHKLLPNASQTWFAVLITGFIAAIIRFIKIKTKD